MIRTSAPLCAALALATAVASAQAPDYVLTAAPGTVSVAPATTIPALVFDGVMPGPTLYATQGQPFRVRFVNQLGAPSSLHFHGVNMPAGMDGVIDVSRPAVAHGQEFLYEFTPPDSGTFWYHPHVEAQMTSGLWGALIVAPANPADDPAYDVDQVVLLHDDVTQAGGMMGGMTGGTAPGMAGHFLNGKTSAGQTPIVAAAGQKLRLRFVNAAAHTSYVVALDGHPMTVTHADGHRVQSVVTSAIPLGPGERYDALVDLNNPGVWSLAVANLVNRNATVVRGVVAYAGSTAPTPSATFVPPNLSVGALLSYSQLAAFASVAPIVAAPNRQYPAVLAASMGGMGGGGMGGGMMAFTINGQAWPNVTPFVVSPNETVQIDFTNTNTFMMGSFRHPMHLHGHAFRLMGTAGGLLAPPRKDTILIRPVGQAWSSASVQFVADNPGEWMFHCHDVDHQMMGMMNTFQYTGDSDGDGLTNAVDWDPLSVFPTLTIPSSAAAFAQGGSGAVTTQVAPGAAVDFYFGLPTAVPLALAPFGTLFLDFPTWAGTAVANASGDAALPYVVPFVPGLSGTRLALQSACAVPFAPFGLLSTWQAFTVQ